MELKQLSQEGKHPHQSHQHGRPDDFPEPVKGLAHLKQNHHAHNGQDSGAHRGNPRGGERKHIHKRLTHQHRKHIGQPPGESPPENPPKKMPGDPIVVGLHGQEERRDSDGQGGNYRQMHGLQGIGPIGEQGDHRQEQRENVLHQKQRSRPLDVVDHPAALRHDLGHGGKIRLQQHQTGQLAGGLSAGGHGHGAVRLLHGQQIVDPVAGHGHSMSLVLQRLHQQTFLLRGHPSEDHLFRRSLGVIQWSVQCGAVHPALCPRNARLAGNLTDGSGVVSGNHPDRNPLLHKIIEGLPGGVPDGVVQNQKGQGLYLLFIQFSRTKLPLIPGQQQHPAALGRPVGHILPQLLHPPAQDGAGCANHKGSGGFKLCAAPLGLRGEGNPPLFPPVRRVGEQFSDGPGRGIIRLPSPVQSPQRRFQVLRLTTGQGDQIFHLHFRLGDGAGFVHAQHIHPGQSFHAAHVLHQHLAPAEFQGGSRHGDGGQQIQPLGNHPHQRRHGSLHAALEPQVQHEKLLVKQDQSHRHQGDAHHQNQLIQGAHHLRLPGFGIALGLPGQPGSEGILPHRRQPYSAPACQHHAAGADGVSHPPLHCVGFSGNQGFIQPQCSLADNAIGAQLVPLTEFRDVIPDQGLRPHLLTLSVPDHRHRSGRHQGQPVHRPLGPDLLNDADDRIDHRHQQKSHVHHRGPAEHQQHRQHGENQVEKGKGMSKKDFLLAFSGGSGCAADPAGGNALLNLLLGQSLIRGRFQDGYGLSLFHCATSRGVISTGGIRFSVPTSPADCLLPLKFPPERR